MIRPSLSFHIFVYFLLLIVLLPLVFYQLANISDGFSLHSPLTLLFGSTIVVFSAFRLTILAWACPKRMLAISFYLFIYIWVGLPPMYQLATGQIPWRMPLPTQVYEQAYAVTLLAIIVFELVYRLTSERQSALKRQNRVFSRPAITIFSILAILMSLTLGPLTTPLSALLSFREDLAGELGDRQGRLIQLNMMRIPILIALLVVIWQLRTTQERRMTYWILFALIIPVFVIVNFPTAINRAWLGAILISVAVTVMSTGRMRYYGYVPAFFVAGFMTAFPLLHVFRREIGDSFDPVERVITSYSTGDFDILGMVAHAINYLNNSFDPPVPGMQLIGSILFFVPRSMWESKPVGSGYHVAEQSGFPFLNVSMPFWGEGFLNFGIFGVILLMAILAYICKRLDSAALISGGASQSTVMFAFLSGFMFIVLRGDMFTWMGTLAPFVASLLLLHLISLISRPKAKVRN